jgi:chitinase
MEDALSMMPTSASHITTITIGYWHNFRNKQGSIDALKAHLTARKQSGCLLETLAVDTKEDYHKLPLIQLMEEGLIGQVVSKDEVEFIKGLWDDMY